MYLVDTWMVDGKPGTGNTPVEKLFSLIFALWHLASILPVMLTYISGSTTGKRVAILAPLFYHVSLSIHSFLFFDSMKVCNPLRTSANFAGVAHAVLSVVCLIIYKS